MPLNQVDDLQDLLVRVGLEVLADHGFALAGGHALQAHNLVDRLSEDVDMFTSSHDPTVFVLALNTVVDADRNEGLRVDIVRQAEAFARLEVIDETSGMAGSVDLAADYRMEPPVVMDFGPVLAESDAVAAKVAAVFSRGYARDYIDLAGILGSGRFSQKDLLDLGVSADGGFTRARFVEALTAIERFGDDEFTRYGIDPEDVKIVRTTIYKWSQELSDLNPRVTSGNSKFSDLMIVGS